MMDGEQFVDCVSVQYVKQLSPSDAACSKQIKLPKSLAKKFVGELRHKQSTVLTVLDQVYGSWEFLCTCYGCQYALSRVGTFCNTFRLKAGQFLVFYLDSRNRLRVGASCNISPELQQRFSHRQAGSSNTSSSSNVSGASPTHPTAAVPANVLLSGSSSDGSEQKALGKRARRVVEQGADVMAVKDQATSFDHLPQNAWSRAPSPDDNMMNAAALYCPYSSGAFEQRMAKRLCSASPVNQLTNSYLQQRQQQQQHEQCYQGPVTSMKPGSSSDAFQQQLQQQLRQKRCVTTAVLPPPALFSPPLCRSNSSSDSGDSSGTCTSAGFARLGLSCIGSSARMKALGLLIRQGNGSEVAGLDGQEPALELLQAPGSASWQSPAIAAGKVMHSDMAAAAAATTAVTAAQGSQAGQWMPIKPTPIRAGAPTPATATAAAAATAGAWPARPLLPLLTKALTKMDVACAHDRVGIVLPIEDVLRSQLLSSGTGSLDFVVGDEAGSNWRFSCRISASANGRFAYLTGLGALLSRAAARAGDAVCISVAQGGAGLVAGVRRAEQSA